MQILLAACDATHLNPVSAALHERNALAALWTSTKNEAGLPASKYRRAWVFHLAIKPFYHLSPRFPERIFHGLLPLWTNWVKRQKPPAFEAVQALMGYGAEVFDHAERIGALKVIDASNSHPTSYYGFWQRECDLWNPGTRPGVPRKIFARGNRDLERADLISCPSVFVRDSMIYNGIPEEKCVLNPYGVNTRTFIPRDRLPEKPRFICVGLIGLRKGQQYLFRAFQRVRERLPEAELICAGGYHADFSRERPRWEGTFTHYPHLPHRELAALLRSCTAFVLPTNEEGFARAIIEAMASGLPVITTYQSGATTLVRDGVEGRVINGRNVPELAAAMIQVAEDRALNERMGQAAHARGAGDNSWGDYADRLLEIYARARHRALRSGAAADRSLKAAGAN